MTRSMEKIVALCKRRGFIFQNSEIYGGQNGFWDYGPLGTELKRNVRDVWYHDMVSAHNELVQPAGAPATFQMVGLESALIMHPQVWKCSGHYDLFHDMMVDCTESRKRFRLDHVKGHWVRCNGKSVKVQKPGTQISDSVTEEVDRVFVTTTESNPIEHVKERALKIFDLRSKDAERLQIEESGL
jgi:glycyl-tRNA synthetase